MCSQFMLEKFQRQKRILSKVPVWPLMPDMEALAQSEGMTRKNLIFWFNSQDTSNCLLAEENGLYFFPDSESKIRTLRYVDYKIQQGGLSNG